jgi:Fe-S cluster biogenesis protein NfuA
MSASSTNKVTINIESTPNPASQKFVINQKISEQSFEFKREGLNGSSPLAKKLFGFPWVDAVFIGTNFVTITKQDWVDWETLSEALASLISEHIETNQGIIVTPKAAGEAGAKASQNMSDAEKSHAHHPDDSADIQLIKKLLDAEIRPAVAMDGGDVMFHKYEDQVVYLHLRGACNSCPSSTYTLKTGIASKLREYLPELRDVEAV